MITTSAPYFVVDAAYYRKGVSVPRATRKVAQDALRAAKLLNQRFATALDAQRALDKAAIPDEMRPHIQICEQSDVFGLI